MSKPFIQTPSKPVRPALHGMPGEARLPSIDDIMRQLAAGRPAQAEQWARQRLLRFPADAQALYALSVAATRMGRYEDAELHLRQALAIAPKDAALLNNCGMLLLDADRVAEALPLFERAAALDKRRAAIRLNCAISHHSLGNFEQATDHYRAAIALDPRCGQAYLGLANCRKFEQAEDAFLNELNKIASKRLGGDSEACMHYALAKIFDELGRCDDAFAEAARAHAIEKSRQHFDRAACGAGVTERCTTQNSDWFASHRAAGNASDMPILVVGMPRSGTSLVEQMLSNHPAVGGAGELAFWEAAYQFLCAHGKQLDGNLVPLLAGDYLRLLSSRVSGKARVIDKMPENFHYAGLFHASFPKGKIIHCRRHPLDTCLSIYFHKFTGDFPYAHDLNDLAFYYTEYLRMTDHWRTVLPAQCWLDVDYEDLVADPAGEARRMMDFLGLDFDDAVLHPEQNHRPVRTSSAWQVRQPVYRNAQGKWRRYETHLAPLMGLIEDRGPAR
jgi:tetratricopeptide (TPR) repeat protein